MLKLRNLMKQKKMDNQRLYEFENYIENQLYQENQKENFEKIRQWEQEEKEFKKECRIRYIDNEIRRLKRNIQKSQLFLERIMKKTPSWFYLVLEDLKDSIVVINSKGKENALRLQGNRIMLNGIGGYMIYNYNRKLRIDCGLNLKEKIRKLKRIEFELECLKDNRSNGGIDAGLIARAKKYPINRLIEVNRQGFCHCPFHKEKTPSFKVYKDTNTYHCFGACNESGDTINLLMKRDNLTFKQAIKFLTQ